MVLLIKNKLASFEDFVHLPNLAGEAHGKQLSTLGGHNLRNAGVPKAKSMVCIVRWSLAGLPYEPPAPQPHINLLVEGGSLRAHCSAVLNADFQGLKPGKLFARKVKSTKDDLKHLFNQASRQHRVERAGAPTNSISMEPVCSTATSDVNMTRSLGPSSSSSPTFAVPALSDEDEDEGYLHSLTAVAHRWLTFEQLFPRRRALSNPTIEEARHDFCQALIQSFPDHLPRDISSQVSPSSEDSVGPTLLDHASMVSPPASSRSVVGEKSPEFSDEELQREFDNFSFHSSDEEEWTSEIESRKQNTFNRMLLGMKRELAIPIPKLSAYFSDDSLADSAAHRTPANPQVPCSVASSEISDESSIYSADQEEESDEDEESVADSLPDSLSRSDTLTTFPPSTTPPLFDARETQDSTTPSIAYVADEIDDVWKALATHVPRLLTRISEESLADEYEVEATGQAPPLSFRRPISQYRERLQPGPKCTSLSNCMDSKPVVPSVGGTELSETEPSDTEPSPFTTTTTDNGLRSSSVASLEVSFQNFRTLRRARKFTDLKVSYI